MHMTTGADGMNVVQILSKMKTCWTRFKQPVEPVKLQLENASRSQMQTRHKDQCTDSNPTSVHLLRSDSMKSNSQY
jgi:hypothetical protein